MDGLEAKLTRLTGISVGSSGKRRNQGWFLDWGPKQLAG